MTVCLSHRQKYKFYFFSVRAYIYCSMLHLKCQLFSNGKDKVIYGQELYSGEYTHVAGSIINYCTCSNAVQLYCSTEVAKWATPS